MHLSRIEIDHFRSLKHLTVNLQTGLNVLVGRNNVGKTNLLQAIRHALGPSASRGDSLWLERDDFYRDSSTDPIERTISITLTFSKLSEAERSYFFEIVEFDLADLSKSTAVIRFEANWPKGKRQASIRRTGGAITTEPAEVPTQILESFPITFLPALRNAEASLAPGHRSRLAVLLRDLAGRDSGAAEIAIKGIYKQANENLEAHPLISTTKTSLQGTTKSLAGSDYSPTAIRAADADFEKILRTLQVQMDGAPIGTIDANGLGYNNLLYMAVVLEHLKSWNSGECPLLLIEEPEAHLHPQLTMLLADYLGTKIETPQTIVTTHSPTLAASVPPSQVHVLFRGQIDQQLQCNSIAKAAMDQKEQRSLQRMMDITRATLYFAKAAILVEGVSESLLLPVLANRLGHDMAKLHVSVIPICGVAFPTFKKLLDSKVLGIPIAIVTDADPPVPTEATWREATPETENGSFKLSERTKKLIELFKDHQTVKVFHSKLTLEYDLAEAGDDNSAIMANVWAECFTGNPGTFNVDELAGAATRKDKALITWRGICRAKHTGSKAEFAHLLAAHLEKKPTTTTFTTQFGVPEYLIQAITYVANALRTAQMPPSGEA